MMMLELAIEDAIFRIRREYERTEGKIYLSFSGGKDSTVLAHLIMMADLPTPIPFVFGDTGIEMEATKRFVAEFDYPNKVTVKPRKPFAQVLKDHGKPSLSKLKSNGLKTYQRHLDEPLKTARARQMILGVREKNGQQIPGRNSYRLPNHHMHFIHPDTEIKFSSLCCEHLKKYPLDRFEKENDMRGVYTGVRTSEGGVRSLVYNSCVIVKKKRNKEFISSMPIIDWTDELMSEFIDTYHIQLSDAYTVYGCDRTGCCGCPFSANLERDLEVLYKYEPKRYKAAMFWLEDVYHYQLVECQFDEEYMKRHRERLPIIEQRREEMLETYRDKENRQLTLF